MRSTQTSSLFPKQGDHNAKKNEEARGQRARGDYKTRSARSINHNATQNENNTGTNALQRSVRTRLYHVLNKMNKCQRQTESGRTLTSRINHNRSTALESQ